ncbi:MAG: CapA family protein [Turneriella sp.]
MHIARTPYESFRPGFWQTILYRFLVKLFHFLGIWRRGRSASGDLATMSFIDKVYWLYKTIHPVVYRFENHVSFADVSAPDHRLILPPAFKGYESVSLSAAGDLIFHEFVRHSKDLLYEEVADFLFGTDLPMANLECVIADVPEQQMKFSPKAGPTLTYSLETFDIVRQHAGRGFRFLATACNHSLDLGESGIHSTVEALHGVGIAFNGIQSNGIKAPEPTLVDIGENRLAILAVTFGLNARRPPADGPHMVHVADLNALPSKENLEVFSTLLSAKADFRIVHLHWGMEHEHFPREEQIRLAHHLADEGIDLIIGHHPHVIQPAEFYKTKRDGGRVVPIFYSLGNLINNYAADYLCESLVARINLISGSLSGIKKIFVTSVGLKKVRQIFDEKKSQLRVVPI